RARRGAAIRRGAVSRRPLVALLLVVACRPSCTPRAGETRPNVVLVTIDTLRADHLACYGSRTVRTPELDRLASEGARFERCYAQSHLTVPSHLTIFTSLPPAEHGVLDNGWKLRRRVEALPAVFARAGYRTAAFVSAKHVGPEGTLRAPPPRRARDRDASAEAPARRHHPERSRARPRPGRPRALRRRRGARPASPSPPPLPPAGPAAQAESRRLADGRARRPLPA